MTSNNEDIRIAVLGVGVMGADHVTRITEKISGARITVINDYFPEKAREIAATVPGARVVDDALEAIAADHVDAVIIATPGPSHHQQVLACLDHGKPVMCEKPLTTEAATSLDLVRAEAASGRKLIQVGFMRRFDNEYEQLKALIDSGDLGQALMIHCVHRNPAVPHGFDSDMVVKDSVVHEADVARFLLDEEIVAVTIMRPTPNRNAPAGLQDPQVVVFESESGRLVDAEVFVTTGVAYEVRTEVVGELGSAMIGLDVGLVRTAKPGARGGTITPSFRERFSQAYDTEIQRWVAAVRRGAETGNYVDGPGAWDGYAAAAVCAAGVEALHTGRRVEVDMVPRSSVATTATLSQAAK